MGNARNSQKALKLATYLGDVRVLQHISRNDPPMESTMVRAGLLHQMMEDVLAYHAEPAPPKVYTAEEYDKEWSHCDSHIRKEYAHVEAVVEATREEQHSLWHRYHYHPMKDDKKLSWESENVGLLPTIGYFGPNHEFSVTVSLMVVKVDGINILFYHPTSLYVNHDMVREFIENIVSPEAWECRSDSTNFHNALHAAQRTKEKAA